MSDHPPYSFVQWALPRFHRVLESPAPLQPIIKLVVPEPKPVPTPEIIAEPPVRLAS